MILGIDSSAISAGCELMDSDGRINAEQYMITKPTHSPPMIPKLESHYTDTVGKDKILYLYGYVNYTETMR